MAGPGKSGEESSTKRTRKWAACENRGAFPSLSRDPSFHRTVPNRGEAAKGKGVRRWQRSKPPVSRIHNDPPLVHNDMVWLHSPYCMMTMTCAISARTFLSTMGLIDTGAALMV